MGWVKRAAGFLAILLAAANAGQAKTLQITPLTLASGTVGVSYSQALSATGGTAPYTWSVTVGTLPVGLAISSGGTISGSPQNSGTSVFTVKAQDGAGDSGTQSLQITVISNPVITTATLPNATAGLAYSTTVASSGAVSPVSWTISLGSLPQGLSLAASTGVISGTPAAAGAASFTVKLTDSGGGSATEGVVAYGQREPACDYDFVAARRHGGSGVLANARRFGRDASVHVVAGERIAAGRIEFGGGRDDLGHAWQCRIEQLHRTGDR